jgi:hypothetical protein
MFFRLVFLFFPTIFLANSISFTKQIKPILDKRCVVCHSCYNSPCQTKYSSYEGLQRGGTKIPIYENRLTAAKPTRLFVDATEEEGWREKGFYSILDSLDNQNNSLMSILLEQKQKFPISIGSYAPEEDKLSCSKNLKEVNNYIKEKPNHGMPYGFPALQDEEYTLLLQWLKNNAPDDTKKNLTKLPKDLKIFEAFLNNQNVKHQVTARYIYEHLFLAHIKFTDSKDFYKIIRSFDKEGKKPVTTRLPYGKVDGRFYYVFKKIESTIVHKTHMVYTLNQKKLQRFKDLFIKPTWDKKPTIVSYDPIIAANPLTAYSQIPKDSRYQFLLDDVHFFIMNFIRGPVCKGQIALNVINDHFWIAFKDPKYDETIINKNFIKTNQELLSLPNAYGANTTFLESLDFYKYDNDTINYYKNKNALYQNSTHKLNLKSLWKGNDPGAENNDAMLTIYRHFDSASVHKGALGSEPRTMWVIDFPLLERLYYSLVAGFDVFGNTQHKVLVRKYMDRLRIEGESNFLVYLPKDKRQEVFNSWYQGPLAKYFVTYTPSIHQSDILFETDNIKSELMNKILEYTNTPKDTLNYTKKENTENTILDKYTNKKQIEKSLKYFTSFRDVSKFKELSSQNFNLIYIRFKMKKQDLVYSVIVNRWHDNVAFMFVEDERLDAQKDSIDIIEGFVGSYPNFFMVIEEDDIPTFFKALKEYDNDETKLRKYFVARNDPKFWNTYDWFQNKFYETEPIKSGLFDLNRYYRKTFD